MEDTNIENRLTEQDECGNWNLKGVKWSDLYAGSMVTRGISDRLYGALAKLHDYEETELMPDQIEDLKSESYARAQKNTSPDIRGAADCLYDLVIDCLHEVYDADSQKTEAAVNLIIDYLNDMYQKQKPKEPTVRTDPASTDQTETDITALRL